MAWLTLAPLLASQLSRCPCLCTTHTTYVYVCTPLFATPLKPLHSKYPCCHTLAPTNRCSVTPSPPHPTPSPVNPPVNVYVVKVPIEVDQLNFTVKASTATSFVTISGDEQSQVSVDVVFGGVGLTAADISSNVTECVQDTTDGNKVTFKCTGLPADGKQWLWFGTRKIGEHDGREGGCCLRLHEPWA